MIFIKCRIIFVLLLLSTFVSAQKMATMYEAGKIAFHVQAEGWLIERTGTNGYKERPGYFPDPIGQHRTKRVQSIIFAGGRVRLGITNREPQWKMPSDYYYKIIDRRGTDITRLSYSGTQQPIKGLSPEHIGTASHILLDTTLSVGDYLFADFYDSRRDTLIRSYYFKRVRLALDPTEFQKREMKARPDTTVTIEFANTEKLPGNVLEYRLINDNDTTVWSTSNFTIKLDYLKANSLYKLEARYNFQPETITQYTFLVEPYWYQKSWFTILKVLGAVSLILLIARHSQKQDRQKKELLQQKLRSVQSQLNPHFIFNSMSSIQAMINTGRINEANEYLSEFSTLMRSTLNGSDKIYNPLDTEISILDTYLKLENIRFGFDYMITVQHGLNSSEIEVPVLFFQPLVENAVKHGVSALKEKGQINIHFFTEGRKFICRIEDNGQGYSYQQQEYGYGFRLTNDRIKLINEMTKQKSVELEVESSEGTVIKVIFNDWL